MRCGAAAEHRAVAGGSDRGKVPRVDARRLVADPIDAAVLLKQRTEGEPVLDLGLRDARAKELRSRDDAVRPARDAGDFAISVN
ncbi:MAG TPA: hypothetical protein VHR88_03595 [Solirubrobacteraceae bacterium]|nr:hypothetical protein [Solirubrobacteraceae bacterium]